MNRQRSRLRSFQGFLTLLLLLAALPAAGCGSGSGADGDTADGDTAGTVSYTHDGRFIRDSAGRAVILRGVNFPSVEREYWTGEREGADAAWLGHIAAGGFNAIRLVINWDRIEPEPDAIDSDYIALVAGHAKLASDLGLYVVVDMHQDMFGLGFGLHGAPYWACDEKWYATYEPADPFFFGYFSEEVSACFDGFWTDPGLQGHQQRAAAALAAGLRDIPLVLGFDSINEPHVGTFEYDLFDREYLLPFHAAFAAEVGRALPRRLTFFEPAAVSYNLLLRTAMPGPVTGFAGVFAPHYYNGSVEQEWLWNGRVESVREAVGSVAADAARLGVPWVLGEIGGDVRTPNLKEYLSALYGLADEFMGGMFIWIYGRGPNGFSLLTEDGMWNANSPAFLRPAPSAVAGRPVSFAWEYDRLTFTLEWQGDPAAGETEIVLPGWVAEVGYDAELDGGPHTPVVNPAGNRLILPPGGGLRSFRLTVRAPWPGR